MHGPGQVPVWCVVIFRVFGPGPRPALACAERVSSDTASAVFLLLGLLRMYMLGASIDTYGFVYIEPALAACARTTFQRLVTMALMPCGSPSMPVFPSFTTGPLNFQHLHIYLWEYEGEGA